MDDLNKKIKDHKAMAASKKAQELAEQLLGLGQGDAPLVAEDVMRMGSAAPPQQQYGGSEMMDKLKSFYENNKTVIMVVGAVSIVALVGAIGYHQYAKSHKADDNKA